MNVLRQNFGARVVVILLITSLLSLGFYFLEFSNWAETIRSNVLPQASDEPDEARPYFFFIFASLLKAILLMGVPLLLTLGINAVWKRFRHK